MVQAQANQPFYNTISSTVSLALPSNVDLLQLAGTAALVGTGNSDADQVLANSGDDTLIAGSGVATLTGGTGNDTFVINNTADSVTGATSGKNNVLVSSVSFTLPTNVNTLVLTGSANAAGHGNSGADSILGNAGADTLTAGSGTDTLSAGAGLVTMIGGSGTDTFIVNNSADVVQDATTGKANIVQSSASFVLPTNVNTLILTGTGNINGTGNAAADKITANSGNDSLVAGTGADTLIAGSGSDSLISGTGVDSLVGGTGNDLFVINNASDVVSVTSSLGSDTIQSSFTKTLPTNVNTLVLTGTSSISGSANAANDLITASSTTAAVTLNGGAGADTLIAGSGADVLVAGAGIDSMVSGSGNDKFVVNSTSDVVVNSFTTNADTISSSVTFTLPTNINTLVLTGAGAVTGVGNAANDLMTASASTGAVTLNAGNGADTLVAGSSADVLVSGTGVDSLVAGAGNHLFVLSNAADVVTVGTTHGADTIKASVNDTLAANVGTLVLTGTAALMGTGNSLADTLTANSGSDTLTAGLGLATMIGGTGNDLFVINATGDVVTVSSTTGSDTLSSSVTYTLPANVNSLVLTGSSAISGTANAASDMITASATSGAVTLNGGAGVDTLVAGSGTDVLVAGAGVDSLVSGSGNDKFMVNNTSDVVVDSVTTNADTISSSVTYTLPTNVNTLVLTGAAAITGTGNAANDLLTASTSTGAVTLNAGNGVDTLVAGSGADVLVSGTGIDSLVGGTGNDLFVLTNSADVVTVGATHGVDTIKAAFNDTLAANVGTLVLTGTTALMGTGNSIADTITANSGSDTLVAGSGLATLIGGAGNDLFVVNATGDVVTVSSGTVSDTISSSVSYTLPTNVQYLKLAGGTAALTGTGNTGTSLVVGNTGNDTLNGGTGIAVLEAGTAGAQVLKAASNQAALIGGGTADTLTGGAYKDFFAAGKVGDAITTGATANVIAVNKGDGATVIAPTTGASNVLSLGAGIDTEALTLTKSGNNLVLNDGVAGDSITFTNWFVAASDQTTKTLQVIEAASASYNSAGTDVLRNKPIEEFNFTTLVSQFTAAGSPTGWALSQDEAADTIASSATAAYGGDLAYYYGENGNVTGMNLSASQSTLTNAAYATGLQTIDAWSSISGGAITLNAVVGSSNAALATVTPASQTSTADGRVTVLPVSRPGMAQATYVNTTALAAAMGVEEEAPTSGGQTGEREAFNSLWTSMHRQIDMVRVGQTTGNGAEAQVADISPDAIAMLSGGGANQMLLHDRKVALPSAYRHQA